LKVLKAPFTVERNRECARQWQSDGRGAVGSSWAAGAEHSAEGSSKRTGCAAHSKQPGKHLLRAAAAQQRSAQCSRWLLMPARRESEHYYRRTPF